MGKTTQYGAWQPGGMFAVADVERHPNNVFWVNSVTGSASAGFGYDPSTPLSTIAAAVALCEASKGDVIYVLPGHNEGFGDAQLTINKAGISIIGLGRGAVRPRIDFDHANASIDITANGVALKNLTLLPSITTIGIGIDVNAAVTDTLLEDIEVLPGEDGAGADEFVLGVDIKAGCSRTKIRRLKYLMHASSAHANAGVSLTGASDDVEIADSYIYVVGAAGVAPIKGITTLSTQVYIHDCVCYTDDEPGIELLTGTTGVLANNKVFSNLGSIAAAIVADGCAKFENYYVEVGNEAGALIGTASVDD